jgi:cytochrome c553
MADQSGDIRDQISRALDSLGYESVEQLVRDAILATRDCRQTAQCPKCHRKFTVEVKQPAPDKRAIAIEKLANQAKGAPNKAAERPRQPTMADQLTSLSNEDLARIAGA